jgi:hypothetical protein
VRDLVRDLEQVQERAVAQAQEQVQALGLLVARLESLDQLQEQDQDQVQAQEQDQLQEQDQVQAQDQLQEQDQVQAQDQLQEQDQVQAQEQDQELQQDQVLPLVLAEEQVEVLEQGWVQLELLLDQELE